MRILSRVFGFRGFRVERGSGISHVLAAAFLLVSMIVVWRSFYRMRIRSN
jgi:hypothetical protein